MEDDDLRDFGVRDFIRELHEFHGQKIYEFVGPAIAKKKRHMRFFFLIMKRFSGDRCFNMAMVIAAIIFYKIFRFPDAKSRVFQFGLSENNIRSFERLRGILKIEKIEDVSLNGVRISIFDRLNAIKSMSRIWAVAKVVAANQHATPLAHTQTVLGCAALLIYLSRPFPAQLKVICVASDHSPVSMALLYVARRRRKKTCYIQHAPVTEYFPPLRHDLSILFDRASALAYDKAAANREINLDPAVILLSPFETKFQRPRLRFPVSIVGICLSFLPELKALLELLHKISAEPSVERIILRPHPRCRLDLRDLLRIEKVQMQRPQQAALSFFEDVNVVLVPNSGVAIESLHCGKPTFYVPGMDQIKADYYGFVEAKIVPVLEEFDMEALKRFSSFFDDNWIERYRVYDETVGDSSNLAKSEISKRFRIFLE